MAGNQRIGRLIRDKVKANVFTVYPVAEKELDNIVGVVHLKDLFGKIDSPDFNLKDFICPAKFFPENQSVYNTLEYLKPNIPNTGW